MEKKATPLFEMPQGPLTGASVVVIGVAVGIVMMLSLGWFMYFLVHNTDMRLSDSARTQLLDFVRMKRDETVERKERKPERPQPREMPDTPPTADATDADSSALNVNLGFSDMNADMGIGGLGIGGDSEFLPIVKVAPQYPRRALLDGTTGQCVVRYTVTTIGTVKDIEVLRDRCTDVVFIRPSIEAAKRFKYKPRVIDGTAVEVTNVHNTFYYEQVSEEDANR